jgi:tetratricopeptide (TPR) repeat protein
MLKFVITGLLLASGFGAAQDMKEVPKEAPKSAPAAVATSVPAVPDDLTAAALLYRQGEFDAAIQKYQQFMAQKPNSSEAYAGLTRVYLKQKNVQLANETISKGVQVADGPAVRVALSEVYFRQGKVPEAEREWVNAINSGHLDARAYLGLATLLAR